MIPPNVKLFDSPAETVHACAIYLVDLFNRSDVSHIALSGGSTPKILFDYLAEHYPSSSLWQKVHFYWGDERCVPPADIDSNYRMAREHLLDRITIPKANIHRIRGENDPDQEAQRYAALLAGRLPLRDGFPVFDLVILGLGDDGHTASIFPGQMHLLESKNMCDVAEHPQSRQKRITLSGRTINNTNEILFLVTGENKKERVFEILTKSGQWKEYPASFISARYGKLHWLLDRAAASQL